MLRRCLTSRPNVRVGDWVRIRKTLTQEDVEKFAQITGDFNPIHLNEQPESKRVVHGAFLNGIVSGVIGTKMPGPGTIVISQQFTFPNKCIASADKEIEVFVEILDVRKIMKIGFECVQDGKVVFKGDARLVYMKE